MLKAVEDAAVGAGEHPEFTITATMATTGILDAQNQKKKLEGRASMRETMSFVFDCGPTVRLIFIFGAIGGFLNGLVYPILAYAFSHSFANIAGSASNGLSQVRQIAYTFLVIGIYGFIAATIQGWSFEILSVHASHLLRVKWFQALLRQDTAYYDVYQISGIANQIEANALKYRRGIGRKFGEGIQFFTTGVGGIAFAFYSSWRVALVVLSVIPVVSLAAASVMTLNQTKGSRAAASYQRAGSVAYASVASIKTVLSLNAVSTMVYRYGDATQEAFIRATSILVKQGIANGAMLGAFISLYAVLTLYGSSLLYRDVEATGCDPSDSVKTNVPCANTGAEVFGAMLGIAFAGQGISQFSNFVEAFSAARAAVCEALHAIRRVPGAPEQILYKVETGDEVGSTTHSGRSRKSTPDHGNGEVVKAILPLFEIDSLSTAGLKPESIEGAITFRDVHFTYPTRPNHPVLKGFTVDIKPGQTVAFVGPSGGGKSTIVGMIERFYDPLKGTIELDGINLKQLNVRHLRSSIGYVGQEPTLFATTIRGNIKYGNPNATQHEIEEAARMANAHDFVMSFSDGYDTQVGDKGSQLSGGQKQRIAIARVLVGKPRILLLDEATSALDAESELVVQDALDNILRYNNTTTIIIAHRLTTIRNADVINVIVDGQLVESGTHEELMSKEDYYFRLVRKQEGKDKDPEVSSTPGTSRSNSEIDLGALEKSAALAMNQNLSSQHLVPLIEFKSVKFAYPTRPKKMIFDGFNLQIAKGQTVALVGPSGGGKSTTVGLIERFYDPLDGVLEFMGNDVRMLNVKWYRDQIGYVGQEPTLFDDTIAGNIVYGAPGATRQEIIAAAKKANAHDFIMSFPEQYDTPVGERGTQLSGGQKQRVAIARALVKCPPVLILDEATSALDNESEAVVQAAIDELMQSREQTVLVIAHRLSTIRNADNIALIAEGKVLEFGPHDELIQRKMGRYKRLFESSKRVSTLDSVGLRKKLISTGKVAGIEEEEEEEEIDWEAEVQKEEAGSFSVQRARAMIRPEAFYMIIGAIGSVLFGGVFPIWGVMFAESINLLFRPVNSCSNENGGIPGFDTCAEYYQFVADDMQETSFRLSGYWAIVIAGCLIGNILVYWGFGMASERLNKRVRDCAFESLLRQEVSYFDKRAVGTITSKLQDDAARLHAFSAEPLRSFIVALASVVTGVTLSFIVMWPFALLTLGSIPPMGFAASIRMKQMMGQDGPKEGGEDNSSTPGGILVETLINMKTVSALTLEAQRFEDYEKALARSDPNYKMEALVGGVTSALSVFIQQWINALQFWWGGWLLYKFPSDYTFKDFLIANFAVLFSLFGLASAFQDVSDRKEVEASAGRIFHLLDRESEIDPLSPQGKTLS